MARHVITKAADIPPGSSRSVQVAGRDIAVFNVDGQFFGLADRCPHRGAKLSTGMIVGRVESAGYGDYALASRRTTVRCPWHGWEYDLRTGQSFCEPDRVRARGYAIEAVSGGEIVEGPFKADAFPIEREADYLVIDLPG